MLDLRDPTGIRREREKLGGGRWSGALLLLIFAGVPLMLGAHVNWFPDSTRERVFASYSSLDEVPVLFDPVTQEAHVRYCGDPEGEVEFVGRDVEWSPTTGERCWPLTPAVVKMIRQAEANEREAAASAVAEREAAAQEARRRANEEEQREAARREAAAFKERYIRGTASLGAGQVAVAVSDDGLERVLASALRNLGTDTTTSLFTDNIFGGSVFSGLTSADRQLLSRLGLEGARGTLLLATLRSEPLAKAGVGNAVNMRGHLTVHLVPLSGGAPVSLPTVSEVGAGFNEEQARQALYKRLAEALLEEPAFRKAVSL